MTLVGLRPVYAPVLVGCACSRTYLPSPEMEDEARRIAGLPPIDRSTRISVGQEDPNASTSHALLTAGIVGAAFLMWLMSAVIA